MKARRLAGLMLVSGALGLSTDCARKPPAETFSCERLQKRAEACESQTLLVIRQRMDTSDAGPELIEQQYKMVESRYRQRLQEKRAQRQCEKAVQSDGGTTRAAKLQECFAAAGCAAFAACIVDA